MKSWVKLYTEINHDPTIGVLSWAERGIWSALLALAGEIDARDDQDRETGELDTPENVAWRLRCDPAELSEAMMLFQEQGMVEDRGGVVFVVHYGERQSRAPSSRHERVLERVTRHRVGKRNEDVTTLQQECNEAVTTHREESKSDTESDPEVGACAPAATPQPVADPAQKPAKKADVRGDPRSKMPAIQCVRGITSHYPPREMYEQIMQLLGEQPDGKRLAECRHEWIERGYNPARWHWLTDWYVNGISDNGRARASPTGFTFTEDDARRNRIALGKGET